MNIYRNSFFGAVLLRWSWLTKWKGLKLNSDTQSEFRRFGKMIDRHVFEFNKDPCLLNFCTQSMLSAFYCESEIPTQSNCCWRDSFDDISRKVNSFTGNIDLIKSEIHRFKTLHLILFADSLLWKGLLKITAANFFVRRRSFVANWHHKKLRGLQTIVHSLNMWLLVSPIFFFHYHVAIVFHIWFA